MRRNSVDYFPFISSTDDDLEDIETAKVGETFVTTNRKVSWRRCFITVALTAQIILDILVFVTIFYVYSHKGPRNAIFPQALYSPAQDVLEYQAYRWISGFGSEKTIYQGPPSDAVDEAWEELYSFGISQIPKNQAARLTNRTRPIPGDEGNYIVELDVFHELHCLNIVRWALNAEYYSTRVQEGLLAPNHISHCLDSIRQSLMCSSDISTIVWVWDEVSRSSLPSGSVMHTCRNFERIQDWARENHIVTHFNNSVFVADDMRLTDIISLRYLDTLFL